MMMMMMMMIYDVADDEEQKKKLLLLRDEIIIIGRQIVCMLNAPDLLMVAYIIRYVAHLYVCE